MNSFQLRGPISIRNPERPRLMPRMGMLGRGAQAGGAQRGAIPAHRDEQVEIAVSDPFPDGFIVDIRAGHLRGAVLEQERFESLRLLTGAGDGGVHEDGKALKLGCGGCHAPIIA